MGHKCMYDECRYIENFSTMPAIYRVLYIVLSAFIVSKESSNNSFFSAVILLFIPLFFEYLSLSKSGKLDFRKIVAYIELITSFMFILLGILGLFGILIVENKIIILNKEYLEINVSFSVKVITRILVGLSTMLAILDCILIPTKEGV